MKKILCNISAALLIGGVAFGCGKKEEDNTESRSLEDYKKEAQEEITAENAEEELDALEKQIAGESEALE